VADSETLGPAEVERLAKMAERQETMCREILAFNERDHALAQTASDWRRIARIIRDSGGRRIEGWAAECEDGEPDFRVAIPDAIEDAFPGRYMPATLLIHDAPGKEE
jgi:hypothetical protein